MDANKSTPSAGESVSADIERGNDFIRADCGNVETAAPVAKLFAIADQGKINITGYRAEDTGNHNVELNIKTGCDQPQITLKQILTAEQARDIAERLEDAAAVAAGEVGRSNE